MTTIWRGGGAVTLRVLIAYSPLFAYFIVCHVPFVVYATTATATTTTTTKSSSTYDASIGTANSSHFYLSANDTHQPQYAAASIINGSSATMYAAEQLLSLAQLNAAGLKVTRSRNTNNNNNNNNENDTKPSLPPLSGSNDLTGDQSRLYEKHLEQSSVVFGLTKVANASNVNPFCFAQLRQLQRSILRKEPWAMKVLDASGAKQSGFVFGQNFWLGSREACSAVRKPVKITFSRNYERIMNFGVVTDQAPFEVDYRVIYLRHNSPWQIEIKLMSEQIIHIGLCLPSACASSEIQQLTTEYVSRGMFIENDIFDIRPEVIYMKDMKLSDRFYQRYSFKLLTALLTFTVAAMLLASHLRMRALAEAEERKNNGVGDSDCAPIHEPLLRPPQFVVSAVNHVKDFALCFDIIENFERLSATKANLAKEIPVINGLRSISAIWILIFHVFWYMYFTVNNKAVLISLAESLPMQYISSAPILVDVFFTVSGFLQTYNFLNNAKNIEEVRNNTFGQNVWKFAKMLFHRYLRLAPLYLTLICMVDLFFAYIGEVSVFHVSDPFDQHCSRYWWRNIFFIQNLYDHNDLCLNWTWSLACEMQYFIIASILLLNYAKRPKLVKAVVVLLLTATVVWSFYIGINAKFQLSFDSFFLTGSDIYISPFVRVLPYILGACVAWLLSEKLQSQFELSDLKEKCLWCISIVIFISCFYSTIWRDLSSILCTILFIVGRIGFSLSICWMIVGSATGRSVWWSRVLEAKIFQHFNRLSYAIYLINPFVIAFFFSLNNASTHVDRLMACILTTGFIVIVYLVSIVFSLSFEVPYSNWSSKILRRSKQKTK